MSRVYIYINVIFCFDGTAALFAHYLLIFDYIYIILILVCGFKAEKCDRERKF